MQLRASEVKFWSNDAVCYLNHLACCVVPDVGWRVPVHITGRPGGHRSRSCGACGRLLTAPQGKYLSLWLRRRRQGLFSDRRRRRLNLDVLCDRVRDQPHRPDAAWPPANSFLACSRPPSSGIAGSKVYSKCLHNSCQSAPSRRTRGPNAWQ